MATIAERRTTLDPDHRIRERRFFLGMALAIAVTVIAGFSLDLGLGRVGFGMFPWQVHAHAIVFGSWIVLYVVQNRLVVAGNTALHRRLGLWGAIHAGIMVPLGIGATTMTVVQGRVPSFFPPGVFLVVDILGIVLFGALVAASLTMRKRLDWHKRLMLCANILVMSPALGRILPMPLFGPFAPLAVFAALMAYVVVAMLFDRRARGRVHPAYWWGGGIIGAFQLSIGPLGFSPPVLAFATYLAR